MRRTVLSSALALVMMLAGCGAGKTRQSESAAGPAPSSPNASAAVAATEVEQAVEERTPPPSLDIECPEPGAAPAMITFGWDGEWYGEPTVRMDYGDGRSYTAVGEQAVRADVFEHRYTTGGDFVVTATLENEDGQSVVATCALALTEPVVHAAPRTPAYAGGRGYGDACYFEGHRLYGDVEVVEYGGDIRVQAVDFAADIRVEKVEYGAYSCGEWHFVKFGGDFSVEFVDYAADLRVQFVDFAPGMN